MDQKWNGLKQNEWKNTFLETLTVFSVHGILLELQKFLV